MKTKSRFVNNNKNVVNVIIQNPQKKRHTYHKSKESNSESSSISSYSRPNISVPFTNTSNLENEILREQLNNIQSNRNPTMNRIGTIVNDKFRNPLENADETFIKNGNNTEEVDVTSQSDLYKDFNMSIPYENPASAFADDNNTKKVENEKPKRPKPLSQMNKTELKDEYRNLTGSAPVNMDKKELLRAIKAYKFSSPNKR
jgi:hypothetical protein